MPKKNNHTQDSIYVVQQFTYAHEVAEISLFSRKKKKNIKKKKKTLIFKTTICISCA